jgi:hypothetical protein
MQSSTAKFKDIEEDNYEIHALVWAPGRIILYYMTASETTGGVFSILK